LSPNFDITKSGRIWNGTIKYSKKFVKNKKKYKIIL
jgi:hypothetical protein